MKHAYRSLSERPDQVCPPSGPPSPADTAAPDKWEILATLTEAAPDYGLGHRTLGVLRALLTFFPDRELPQDRAVVFPSNRKLSERLHGMPESTLRRHLARLVDLGLLERADSPNRKRYATRVNGATAMAFGLDLAPLRRAFATFTDVARTVRDRKDRLTMLREQLKYARHLYEQNPDADPGLCAHIARVLRRKPSEDDLQACLNALPTPEMSGSAGENERDIQITDDPESDSACNSSNEISEPVEREERLTAGNVVEICREYGTYFPDKSRSWRDLRDGSAHLAGMIGISPPVYRDAVQKMGPDETAISVLCILERLGEIRSPGAYLRRLSQRADEGRFSVAGMLASVRRKAHCQLTITS